MANFNLIEKASKSLEFLKMEGKPMLRLAETHPRDKKSKKSLTENDH